jgi:5'-deoxynucleotidase YfbR-like HD superfamily hydrolase
MNDEMNKFYDTIGNLTHVYRYNDVYAINRESVAEHSFMVASIVVKLAEKWDFDLGHALAMAVTHDWAESVMGDITVKAKARFPLLNDVVCHTERVIYNTEFPFVESTWKEFEDGNTIESLVVKYADVLQCMLYAKKEIELGNKGYMHDVYISSIKRLEELEKGLDNYEHQTNKVAKLQP